MKLLMTITAVAAMLTLSPPASALTFDFSFTNGAGGDVPGTVTGEIVGLTDNATSAALAVYITSSPSALGFSFPPSENILSDPGCCVVPPSKNFFTVTNGVLTAVNFTADIALTNGDFVELALDSALPEYLLDLFIPPGISNDVVSPSASFVATPIPPALPLFSAGLGVMSLFGWRKRRKNAATTAV